MDITLIQVSHTSYYTHGEHDIGWDKSYFVGSGHDIDSGKSVDMTSMQVYIDSVKSVDMAWIQVYTYSHI